MPVKSNFREPARLAPRQSSSTRGSDEAPRHEAPRRALLPDEQRDELMQWEKDQIAADRAERIRLEEERQKSQAEKIAATDNEAPVIADEIIDEKLAELSLSDADKINRLARGLLKNQGVMGAMKLPGADRQLMKVKRQILGDLLLHEMSLSDIEEGE